MLEWNMPRGFDGAIWDGIIERIGGFGPLAGGQRRYRAEVKNWKAEHPLVEIKRDFADANLLLVVALDGWDYKYDEREHQWRPTKGHQVRMSANSACAWTIEEFREMPAVAEEALRFLRELKAFKETL